MHSSRPKGTHELWVDKSMGVGQSKCALPAAIAYSTPVLSTPQRLG